MFSLSTSTGSRRGCEAFFASKFHMVPTSENRGAESLHHSSNDGRCLGLYAMRFLANPLRNSSSLPNLSSRKRRTRPQAHLSDLIGLCLKFFSTSGAIQFFVPHWSSTSSSSSFTRIAMSKSIIFKQKFSLRTRLSGLMSLWAIWYL